MKICLIGGIYGEGGRASAYLRVTPETTLEAGLRAAGHQVTTLSHYASGDFSHFDAVHVHHLSYGATRLACDPSTAPFVFTPHDASQMSGARLSPERTLALRYVLSRADCIVSLSAAEAVFQQKTHGIEAGRLAVIPNGIDASQFPFHRRNRAGRKRPWQLLFVGQLIPLKGCDLILRAAAALAQPVEVTLVYQNATLEAELKALSSTLGIGEKVHFLGRQEPRRLAALYQQSDLLVVASETEALPSVITEAMLSGLPFVATAVGGIREQAGGFGYLLEHRSVTALSAGITHVLTHYEQFAGATAEQMSRRARSSYSIQAMVDGHLAMYRGLAATRPRRLQWRHRAANLVVGAAVKRLGTPRPGVLATENQTTTASERP